MVAGSPRTLDRLGTVEEDLVKLDQQAMGRYLVADQVCVPPE
ncbi:MAG: hypothetical protein VYB39_02325 [Pseudomonadota bacterium]|nr:hypothetical protein [Pseudomonadota bacterium]